MEALLQELAGKILPPAVAAGLVVALARLMLTNWLKDQKDFRARVDAFMETTRDYPEFKEQTLKRRQELDQRFEEVRGLTEFKLRTEDRLRRLYEVDQKVSSLEYAVASVKTDVVSLRSDSKEFMRDMRADMEKVGEKLDDIFKRAFGVKDSRYREEK